MHFQVDSTNEVCMDYPPGGLLNTVLKLNRHEGKPPGGLKESVNEPPGVRVWVEVKNASIEAFYQAGGRGFEPRLTVPLRPGNRGAKQLKPSAYPP